MESVGAERYVGLTIEAAKELAVSEHRNYCVVHSGGVMRTPLYRAGALLVLYSDGHGRIIRAEQGRMGTQGAQHRGAWWR